MKLRNIETILCQGCADKLTGNSATTKFGFIRHSCISCSRNAVGMWELDLHVFSWHYQETKCHPDDAETERAVLIERLQELDNMSRGSDLSLIPFKYDGLVLDQEDAEDLLEFIKWKFRLIVSGGK